MVVDENQPKSLNEARDKYVADNIKDMLYNMKAKETPKGVWLSTTMMSFPLFSATTYLAIMSPMAANAAIIDPNQFAFMARSCLRLLSLNIAFFGGIHFGFSSAHYEVANGDAELKRVQL